MNATAEAGAKRAVRERIRARRDAVAAQTIAAWSDAVERRLMAHPAVLGAAAVFCYVSVGNEVATRSVIDRLVASGCRVSIPNVLGRERMEACEFRGWDALVPGRLGIPSPNHDEPFDAPIDLALVPGLAFTTGGTRLGYGAGYYDRWFECHPRTRRVALAFELAIVPNLPVQAHDVPMHAIVTEERLIAIAPPA
ncbi:MAG: 5-formyltetrahydrofolate cyclo-ligase [Gammaproteobacteria bacterium]